MTPNPRIVAITPTKKKSGSTYYSKKLYGETVDIVSTDEPFRIVLASCLRSSVDVFHLQLEYRTFGNMTPFYASILSLVIAMRRKKLVITLHGVITPWSPNFVVYGAFFIPLKLASLLGAVIVVHSSAMQYALRRYYHLGSTIIPHGTDSRPWVDTVGNEKSSLLFFGFKRPSKGIGILISAYERVRMRRPLKLLIAGTFAREDEERSIKEEKTVDGVTVINRFISEKEKEEILSGVFAIVLPYTDSYVEVSGVVHDVARYGVPIICSDTPRFSELEDSVNCLKVVPNDAGRLAEAIERLCKDKELYSTLSSNIALLPEMWSWEVVKEMHTVLYERILNDSVSKLEGKDQ